MKTFALALSLLAIGCGGRSSTGLTDPVDLTTDSSTPDANSSTDSSVADAPSDSVLDAASIKPGAIQNILFEISRINYAWGPSCSGMYVTVNGEVYTYDFFDTASDAAAPFSELVPGMTEQQVSQKFGSAPKLVGEIDQNELLSKFALLGEAKRGMLLGQGMCADYGMDRFVGYTYDDATSKYSPVMLGIDGDMALRNTSSVADDLIEWLRSEAKWTGERACRFHTASCVGDLCPGVPSCTKDGQVPIFPSDKGCLQACGSPSHCNSVNDCSVCTKAKEACLIDPNGARHCQSWISGCSGTMDCACGGNSTCAGGIAYCHGTASDGIACSAP